MIEKHRKTARSLPTWSKVVVLERRCPVCKGLAIIHGYTESGTRRYKCKGCRKTFQHQYVNKAYLRDTNIKIISFLKEGVGIRSTSRLMQISKTTVLKRILRIASEIKKPVSEPQQIYELDELQTYIGNKQNRTWIAYALDRNTRKVIDFNIGCRNNRMFKPVVNTVLRCDPKRVYTDRLINYRYLLPKHLHIMKDNGINRIERMNLTLRMCLKRLGRRTICYSKSLAILMACVKIFFWA